MNTKSDDFFNRRELRLLNAIAEAKECHSIWDSCNRALGGGDCMPCDIANSGLGREYLEFHKNLNLGKKKESYTLNEKVFDLYDEVQKLIHS